MGKGKGKTKKGKIERSRLGKPLRVNINRVNQKLFGGFFNANG